MTPELKHLEAEDIEITPALREQALEQLFGSLHAGNLPDFIKENIQRNNTLLHALSTKSEDGQ